jgi:hypothetical protein
MIDQVCRPIDHAGGDRSWDRIRGPLQENGTKRS